MTLQKRLANPWIILLCIVLGAVAGAYLPVLGDIGFTLGTVYLAIVAMAALPLQVVAGFFGLRQIAALPRPVLRLAMMAALALALVLATTLAATLISIAARPGAQLDGGQRAYLGSIVEGAQADTMTLAPDAAADGDAESTRHAGNANAAASPLDGPSNADAMSAIGATASPMSVAELMPNDPSLRDVVPDNFYHILASGRLLGILTGTLFFGLAFARLSKTQSQSLSHILEGAYRTLEIIIDRANLCIPVLAFGMTAHLVDQISLQTLAAMSGLVLTFLFAVAVLGSIAVYTVSRCGGHPLRAVLDALHAPMLISLTSGSVIASIPSTIDTMSAQLGYSRAVAELLVPFGTVFVRVGNAVYYACVAIFVATLYHYPLGATSLLLIWLGAALASMLSAGYGAAASIGYVTFVLSFLQLPADAVVFLLLSVDPLCSGARNLLSVLFVCALTALASTGLPSERAEIVRGTRRGELGDRRGGMTPAGTITFAFTRTQLAVAVACSGLIAAFVVLIGIGVGAR
ncbi:cation:dicarboxylase symporter family transporter [Robbsia sp. KACC 23696]|uniref:dicarboxylate/amino acid:cation symporter n=1 Tax=Robbsia sp. KACC 23696 TaxID=3149231 RepID=UPI00325A9B44